LRILLQETREAGRPLAETPEFKRRLAELEVAMETIRALASDQLAAAQQEGAPSLIGAAALKIRGSELQQSILQTITDVLARHGLVFQVEALEAGWNGEIVGPEQTAGLLYEHLYRRAATIYGGSTEIQKNIISKGALGL
jgi:alkylation response protein AidB-like acyl-CoA dehydrogenase